MKEVSKRLGEYYYIQQVNKSNIPCIFEPNYTGKALVRERETPYISCLIDPVSD